MRCPLQITLHEIPYFISIQVQRRLIASWIQNGQAAKEEQKSCSQTENLFEITWQRMPNHTMFITITLLGFMMYLVR